MKTDHDTQSWELNTQVLIVLLMKYESILVLSVESKYSNPRFVVSHKPQLMTKQ